MQLNPLPRLSLQCKDREFPRNFDVVPKVKLGFCRWLLQKGEELPEASDEEEEDFHEQFCYFCKDGGDVILCDFCEHVFHKFCLNPPMKEVPEDDWKCPVCLVRNATLSCSPVLPTLHFFLPLFPSFPSRVFDKFCLNPPMKEVPEDDWKRPVCLVRRLSSPSPTPLALHFSLLHCSPSLFPIYCVCLNTPIKEIP